jgi:predicted RNA binding protein YcfA (HicA-like mRNA interferase family)
MPETPLLSGKEAVKIFSKIGYHVVRQRGSHFRLVCTGKRSITIPNYKKIGRGLLRKILRDAEISLVEFDKLRKE